MQKFSANATTAAITLVVFFLLQQQLLWTSSVVAAKDVPMHTAIPPKMDPIPTLPDVTHRVFFDVEINGKTLGRIVLGLFGKELPKTVENFRALCACDHGVGAVSGKPLCYRGSVFHRIIPYFMIQGGDITHGNGTGGESIYNSGTKQQQQQQKNNAWKAESNGVKHTRKYLLAMASSNNNKSNNLNNKKAKDLGSQFYITTVKAQWLDGQHVIFGTVLEGEDVVRDMEKYGTFGGKPSASLVIVNSGELPLEKPMEKIAISAQR